jgi:hypothetical protein
VTGLEAGSAPAGHARLVVSPPPAGGTRADASSADDQEQVTALDLLLAADGHPRDGAGHR